MFTISCAKVTKGKELGRAYVANYPASAKQDIKFTGSKDEAYVFTEMAACKNVRDDCLEFAEVVTIQKH